MFVRYTFFIIMCLQITIVLNLDPCETIYTCEECIKAANVCVWCAANELRDNGPRCRQNSEKEDWCPEPLQDPENKAETLRNEDFSSGPGPTIQIKPQSYKLYMRPGKPLKFNFSFQSYKDFPIDLYLLLDASKSMRKLKDETAKQSENIFRTLLNMTKNVHIGLGTFIDKSLFPFTLKFNGETYSFKHHLKLTDDPEMFKEAVTNITFGFIRNEPRSGLDALAQVMACSDVVGWREKSRKLVLISTNKPYHAAGDGKSAGLFQPYDGKCHTENFTYTKELVMDYPSVGMINKLASERDIIIIFYIQETVGDVYEDLSSVVSGSKVATYKDFGMLKNDAIVKTLKEIYEKITNKIKLKVNTMKGKSKNFEILLQPNCMTEDGGDECVVEIGTEKHFTGTITMKEYNDAPDNRLDILVEGFDEKLTLDIEFIKSCDCEKEVEKNSAFCYGEKRECGVCKCGEQRYGDRCSCEKSGSTTSRKGVFSDNSTCMATESDSAVCSGHGSCICGTCRCMDRFEGKYCECNMDSCNRDEQSGKICGHGKCDCGNCSCEANWTGDACNCFTSTDPCKDAGGSICHNRGTCVCGECVCDPIAEWDLRRKYNKLCKMQPCSDCRDLQCGALKNCALCSLYGECSLECPEIFNATITDTLGDELTIDWKLCSNIRAKVGCYTQFVYRYNDKEYGVDIIVQKKFDCIQSYLMYGGVCLAILLAIGLGTIVAWKLLTDARDRLEYKRFVHQHQNDLNERSVNPLYRPPSLMYSNPRFRKESVDVRVR